MGTFDYEGKAKQHEFEQREKKEKHDLGVHIFWNWLVIGVVVLVLLATIAAFLATIGAIPWGGTLKPEGVLSSLIGVIVGAIASRLAPSVMRTSS